MKTIAIHIIILIGLTNIVLAQKPKMHIKARIGGQINNYIEKRDSINTDAYGGFQGGFSFRLIHKKRMFEIGFDFVRNYIDFTLTNPNPANYQLQLNSFEIPLSSGYLTYKNRIFRHFLYGGFVAKFHVKSIYYQSGTRDPLVLKPKQSELRNPHFSFRIGTQFDVYMFNFDVNYSIGLNNATKTTYRVQSHNLNFVVGILF